MQNSLDFLLANSLKEQIEKKLGKKIYKKIENRLEEKFSISIIEAISDFQKIDLVLREIFGTTTDNIEKDIVTNFVNVKKYSINENMITFCDPIISEKILRSYGNDSKRKILEEIRRKSDIILNVLKKCNIPKTSGYRIFNELINDGLVHVTDYEKSTDNKPINKYSSLFNKIYFEIIEGNMQAKATIGKQILKESSIIQISRK